KMRQLLDDGNSGDIERVAQVGLKRANATLAKDHVVVSAGKNVLGAEKKLLNRGGHAALQKDGLLNFTERAEKKIVLHVARADLKNIDVLAHHLDLREVHHFADDEQLEFVGGLADQLKAFFAQALEGVRRRARLERSGAQDSGASLGYRLRNRVNLLWRFHGARSCGHNNFVTTDFDAAAQVDDRALRFELAAGEFKRLRDPHHLADTFEKFKVAMIEIAVDTDRAENSVRSAGGAVYVEAAGD